ncbi:hypothetical protein [Burkholderia latens]|nr:hypothetical protein [Burkholderia latens]
MTDIDALLTVYGIRMQESMQLPCQCRETPSGAGLRVSVPDMQSR